MLTIRISALLTAFFLLQIPSAFAGSGHSHAPPIDDEGALTVASTTIKQLTTKDVGLGFGKLDDSWDAIAQDAKRIHTKEKRYYIVSAHHQQEGRTLFILMSSRGEVYDANFTGEFPAIK